MINLFSHAGEVHETEVASAGHLLSNWYYALLLAVVTTSITAVITYKLSQKSLLKTTIAVSLVLLLLAVVLYDVSPGISALSGVAGIIKLLFAAFLKVTKK